jgi:hypothetical protein
VHNVNRKMNDRQEIFSSRLRDVRGNRKKADFARFLGISATLYQRYENGRIPRADILSCIAQRSNVSSSWLLGLDSVRAPLLKTTSPHPCGEVVAHGSSHPCDEPENGPDLTSSHPCDEEDLKPGTTSLPPLNEAPKPAAVLHLDAGESPPPYGQPPDCRIPAGCDVAGEVAAMKARQEALAKELSGMGRRLEYMSVQLATLVGLLGGAMQTGLKAGEPVAEKKAG